MSRLAEALYSIAVAVWVGGMLAIGYIAAPILFSQIADRGFAGNVAGAMFSVIAWIGIGCGAWILLFLLGRKGWRAIKAGVFWIAALMLLLVIAGQFGIQPIMAQLKADALPRQVMESALRDRFAAWHGISSIVFLIQSLLGVALLVLQERGKAR